MKGMIWIHSSTFAYPMFVKICCVVSFSQDIIKVTDNLSRYFFENGDRLLDQAVPVVLTVNDMYSITRRLKLPMDVQGRGGRGSMLPS